MNEKLIIGLPGHPVSALMMFNIVCSPFLKPDTGQKVMVKVTQNIASQPGRDDFVPVVLEEEDKQLLGRPLLGKSGLMSILSLADAFIHIPYEQQGILAGSIVTAWLF
ncbi:molybdopterin biosynthesis protein moea [hydrocarbon metagenome]|uniref:Molybdopterin biosynthesis protein moea n=1 Tax=hydrocarbon metagenome TaxID=938273 RepID=A0A0W8E4E9_9ZZZZ